MMICNCLLAIHILQISVTIMILLSQVILEIVSILLLFFSALYFEENDIWDMQLYFSYVLWRKRKINVKSFLAFDKICQQNCHTISIAIYHGENIPIMLMPKLFRILANMMKCCLNNEHYLEEKNLISPEPQLNACAYIKFLLHRKK